MNERDAIMLDRLLAGAELSPDEVAAIERAVVPRGPMPTARAVRTFLAPLTLALAATAAGVFVVVRAPVDPAGGDEFSSRGGVIAGGGGLQLRCVAGGAFVATASCPLTASLVVHVPADDAAVAIVGTDGVLRPLTREGPGRYGASLAALLRGGTYEVVALPGGTLDALAAALDAGDARLLRTPLVLDEP